MSNRVELARIKKHSKIPYYLIARNWEISLLVVITAIILGTLTTPYYYRIFFSSTPVGRDIPYLEIITLITVLLLFACWLPNTSRFELLSPRGIKKLAGLNYIFLSLITEGILLATRGILGLIPLSLLQTLYGQEIFQNKQPLNVIISATFIFQTLAFIGIAAASLSIFGKIIGTLTTLTLWVGMIYGQCYYHSTALPWPSQAAARIHEITPTGQVIAIIIWTLGATIWTLTKGGTNRLFQT